MAQHPTTGNAAAALNGLAYNVHETLIRFEREHFELDVNSLPIMFDSLGVQSVRAMIEF